MPGEQPVASPDMIGQAFTAGGLASGWRATSSGYRTPTEAITEFQNAATAASSATEELSKIIDTAHEAMIALMTRRLAETTD